MSLWVVNNITNYNHHYFLTNFLIELLKNINFLIIYMYIYRLRCTCMYKTKMFFSFRPRCHMLSFSLVLEELRGGCEVIVRRRGCWWWRWWRERRDIGRASHGGLAADSQGSLSPPRPLQTHQVSKTKRTVRRENILGEAAGRVAWCFASFSDELLQCCSSYGFREVRFFVFFFI